MCSARLPVTEERVHDSCGGGPPPPSITAVHPNLTIVCAIYNMQESIRMVTAGKLKSLVAVLWLQQ